MVTSNPLWQIPRNAGSLARQATRAIKAKFDARVARKVERLRRTGKRVPEYYKKGVNRQGKAIFSGGKDLQLTSVYPQRFCNALFAVWLRATAGAIFPPL